MQAHMKKNPFFLAYIIKNLYLCSVKSSFLGHIIIIVTIAAFASCRCDNTIMSLREAQHVVAQADSLWHEGKMYGVDEGDSATLAQAYERLKELSAFSRPKSEYAHACYHYGKLLRAKDDPVAAMQAFLDATHSGTKDYHILGVYSNIGDICHLAGDFQLSYDMFERSADMFLQNGDTLSYYYALNDMAFELAEQGKKGETLALLNQIEDTCFDTYLIAKTWETRADAYLFAKQYDSAIYCATISMQSYGITMPTCAIIKAQSFYKLLEMDSALWYANILLTQPDASYQDRFNALYIVQHCDSSVCAESILELSSQREDIRYYEYEPQKEKLSQAVQLLEQDLNRKPDLRWLYAILATIVIMGLGLLIYIRRKRRKHQLLSQQIEDLTQLNNAEQLHHEQIVQAHSDYKKIRMSEIENNCAAITAAETFPKNIHWNNYSKMCKTVDDNFYMLTSKLRKKYVLNETEVRLCVLVLLNMGRNQISDILPYASNGVGKLKYRVAQKLGIDSKNLREYLISMLINNIAKD